MAILTRRATVLRTIPFGDTSRIAVLLSPTEGKFKVMVKGYRNPKNLCARALEPFREIEVVYYHRPDRDLQTAAQADVIAAHDGIERDLGRFCYAMACLEFSDLMTVEGSEDPGLYRDLQLTLAVLSVVRGGRAALTFRAFQARTCARAGFLPEMQVCAVCDGEVGAERNVSAAAGGFVCRDCVGRGVATSPMRPDAAGLLRFLLRGDAREVARAYSTELQPAAIEVAEFLERFLAHHIERYRGLKSLTTLGRAVTGGEKKRR